MRKSFTGQPALRQSGLEFGTERCVEVYIVRFGFSVHSSSSRVEMPSRSCWCMCPHLFNSRLHRNLQVTHLRLGSLFGCSDLRDEKIAGICLNLVRQSDSGFGMSILNLVDFRCRPG